MKLFAPILNPYTGTPALVEAASDDYLEAKEQLGWLLEALASQPAAVDSPRS